MEVCTYMYMCNGPYGETCPLIDKALYLMVREAHTLKRLGGEGSLKTKGCQWSSQTNNY